MDEKNKTYASGAVRSGSLPRFRDIDYGFLRRVAEAFSEGAERYEKDFPLGFKNWKKGDVEFAVDVLDHMINHALLLKEQILADLTGELIYDEGDLLEDHLGHLGANLVMLDYFERVGYFRPVFEGEEEESTVTAPVETTSDTPPSDDGVTQLDEPEPGLTARIKQALGIS